MVRNHHNVSRLGATFRDSPWVLGVLVSTLLAAPPLQAQVNALSGPPARAPDKLYAFSGAWASDDRVPPIMNKGDMPLDDEHEAIRAQLDKDRKAGKELVGNEPKCIPNGPVMSFAAPGSIVTIYATADELTIVASRITRHVLIDRPHTPDNLLFDSYAGESVAHWEGKDLVVDTIAVKPEVEISWGIPLGERSRFHMTERFRIVGPNKMEIETVVDDPGVLTKPWKFTRHYSRSGPSLTENSCIVALDHDRDPATGAPGFDLTPPKGTRYIPPGADK